MRPTYRLAIAQDAAELRFADRAAAQALADAINRVAKAGLRGARVVVAAEKVIGRFPEDVSRRVDALIRACSLPPPAPRPAAAVSKADAMSIVRAYGERDGRLYARHASRAELEQCRQVRQFRDAVVNGRPNEEKYFRLHRSLTPVVGPFHSRRKSQWQRDGHNLGSYWFRLEWFADGFIDGLFSVV